MKYKGFTPFYEKITDYFHGGFAGKILFAFFFGGGVLVIQYLSIGIKVFENKGWVLSVLISVAILCLFYATHIFRLLLPQLGSKLDSNNRDIFIASIHKYLSNVKFVLTGIIFGVLNSGMGYIFGLPAIYNSMLEKVTILGSFFVAGFVCGLAILGIFGVTKCILVFSNKCDDFFDYSSQDYCGGTHFIGQALVIFGSVTLIVGVLISLYISNTAWGNKESILVKLLYYFWVIFPYLMSIFVLLIPAISINKALTMYKLNKEVQLTKVIRNIFDELEKTDINPERKHELYKDYDFQINRREELHKMRTWPFSIGTNSTYFVTMKSSIFTSVSSVNTWLDYFNGST